MKHKKIFRRKIITPHQVWKIKRAFKNSSGLQFLAKVIFLIALVLLLVVGYSMFMGQTSEPVGQEVVKETVTETITKEVTTEDIYKISARDGYILGRYGNALDINGEYVQGSKGSVVIVSVNPQEEFGITEVVLPDVRLHTEDQAFLEGEVKLILTRLKPTQDWQQKAVLLDEVLFGDTGNGFDLLPRTRALLAAFGEGDILLDDQEVYGNLDVMVLYTEGIRDDSFAIRNGDKPYSTKRKSDDYADRKDRELHIFFFSDVEDKKNFPQRHVWVNVFFENPRVISVPEGVKK